MEIEYCRVCEYYGRYGIETVWQRSERELCEYTLGYCKSIFRNYEYDMIVNKGIQYGCNMTYDRNAFTLLSILKREIMTETALLDTVIAYDKNPRYGYTRHRLFREITSGCKRCVLRLL